MLKGYKTRITAGLTILGAIAAYLVGDAELSSTVQLVVTSLLAVFIRTSIPKA